MKTILLNLFLITTAVSSLAMDKTDLDNRIFAVTSKFQQLQQQPDKRIPADVLAKAQGVILLDRTKAGFLFAYQGGSGVALVKDPATGRWSAPAFLTANEASLGFQIGAEQNFFVILLMSHEATRALGESKILFGGEASGTAGGSSAGASGTFSDSGRPVLIYSLSKGLYGGAAFKGGTLAPDENANWTYYGQFLTTKEVLFGKKVQTTPAADNLINVITGQSTVAKS